MVIIFFKEYAVDQRSYQWFESPWRLCGVTVMRSICSHSADQGSLVWSSERRACRCCGNPCRVCCRPGPGPPSWYGNKGPPMGRHSRLLDLVYNATKSQVAMSGSLQSTTWFQDGGRDHHQLPVLHYLCCTVTFDTTTIGRYHLHLRVWRNYSTKISIACWRKDTRGSIWKVFLRVFNKKTRVCWKTQHIFFHHG